MQPSYSFLAPRMDGYLPAEQTESVQVVASPPNEYVPISHFVHPSTLDIAPIVVDYSPALQSIGMHDVAFNPVD